MMKQTSALIIKEYAEKRNVRRSVRRFLRKADNRGVNLKT
ncbi:hypothetical protein MY9_2149 [Bacillus sp. JS]|nr:hypothetical protein MY9_2149 [Bacillus sp. JS]